MTVFFVRRTVYDEPSGKCLTRFADATVLDWFRSRWDEFTQDDRGGHRLEALFQCPVDDLLALFEIAYWQHLPAPENDEQFERYLRDHLQINGTILYEPHLLTILSIDDIGMEACSYVFDDVYLSRHGKRAAYLLHDGWQLPVGRTETGGFEPEEPTSAWKPCGSGSGATYFIFLYYDEDDGCLTGLLNPAGRIDGLRLPDLVSYLSPAGKLALDDSRFQLLRSQLFPAPLTANPLEESFRQVLLDDSEEADRGVQALAAWRAYSDWLQEQQDRPVGLVFLEQALKAIPRLPIAHLPLGAYMAFDQPSLGRVCRDLNEALAGVSLEPDQFPDPELCRVHVEDHLAQLCLNTEYWRTRRRSLLYHQWIFFDDLWAAAHRDLANALLRYARCWDVLSPDGPHDDEHEPPSEW
jgi:hypothetical protein